MKIQDSKEFYIASEEEMAEVVNSVVETITAGDVIFLEGNLGAGKTTFTRYLLKALGFMGKVKSPTFTWVEPYDLCETRGFMLYHYDLYRLGSNALDQLDMLGFRDHQSEQSVLVIEWPDRLRRESSESTEYYLNPTLSIGIQAKGKGRRILITRV